MGNRSIPKSVYFYEADKDWWAGPFVKPHKDYNCVEYRLVPVNEENITGNFSPETENAIKALNNKGKALMKQILIKLMLSIFHILKSAIQI